MKKQIKTLNMTGLIALWETASKQDWKTESVIRGWVLDELEERDPEAFEKWLDDERPDADDRIAEYFA